MKALKSRKFGYHSKKQSSVRGMHERMLRSRSRMSEQTYVPVCLIYCVGTDNSPIWVYEVGYITQRRRSTIDYLYVLFLGDGVKRRPRSIIQ